MPSEGSGSCGSECSHSTSPEIVLFQRDEEDTAMGGEEDAGHSDNEETLSQGTVSLLNISTSDKATAGEAACKSDVEYGNWWDEQIHQGRKASPSMMRGLMIMPMVENLARLQTKSVPPCTIPGRTQGVQTLGYHSEPIESL